MMACFLACVTDEIVCLCALICRRNVPSTHTISGQKFLGDKFTTTLFQGYGLQGAEFLRKDGTE